MQPVSCPSCGNTVNFASQVTAYAVCDACKGVIVKQNLDISSVGVTAAIQEDGSPLQLFASGSYQKVPFEIIGRIQVQYQYGFWNEWFVMYSNGNHGWVGEAQGTYFVNFPSTVPEKLPAWDSLGRGATIMLNGRPFVVTDVENARVVACEGELPFYQPQGYVAPVADLRTNTSMGATLDYSENPPTVFLGEYVEYESLAWQNLREVEGW